MAVSAKFVADFNSFFQEVDKSIHKLTGLHTTSDSVSRQLGRMGTSFSGKNIFQEAETAVQAVKHLGGESKLTANEQQRLNGIVTEAIAKYKALGQDAPKHLTDVAAATKPVHAGFSSVLGIIKQIGPALGISFGVGSIVALGRSIGDFSGKMLDLSAQTKLSTTRLQAFNYVGTGAGLTIDDITTSTDQLAKRLGEGDKSVVSALGKMGLGVEELKNKGLDQIMFDIDRALVGVNNQYERANLLNDLFGRSGARMGRILTGSFEEVTRAAEKTGAIIDEELLKKADALDDAWKQGWIKFRAYAVEAVSFVGGLLSKLGDAATEVGRAMREDANSNQFGLSTRGTPTTTAPRGGARARPPRNIGLGSIAPDLILGGGFPLEDLVAKLRATDAEIAKLTKTQRAHIDAAIALGLSHEDIAKKLGLEEEVLKRYIGLKQDSTRAIRDESKAAKEAADAWKPYIEQRDKLAKLETELIMSSQSGATKKLQGLAMRSVPGILPNLNAGLTGGLMFGPGTVSQNPFGGILTTGGPISIGKSLSGALKDLPDVIMSAVTGGGSLVKSIGSLFGGSLFGAGTGLTKSITGGLSSMLGSTIGGALGSILPGVGALIGPAIQGLGKLFGGMFGAEGKKTNRARDAAISEFTGITGDKWASQAKFRELAEAAGIASAEIDKLFSTKKTKEFESALDSITTRMNAFTSDQEADQARLTAAIEKYGLTFEQLGPAFQKQRLDEQAKELIEDWRVLIGSGVEITDVNNAMAGSINEYLQTAVKLGQEVPNAMRPILQKMLEQGTLTDEAGNAITDLEGAGIKFSETMTEGFDKVVKKLDELIARLGVASVELGKLPDVPSTFLPEQNEPVPTPGIMAPWGGGDIPPGAQFAGGTRGRLLNFGRGTPVLLHGRERVSTETEVRAEAGGWATVAASVEALADQMARFTESVQRNMRDGLAIQRGRTA